MFVRLIRWAMKRNIAARFRCDALNNFLTALAMYVIPHILIVSAYISGAACQMHTAFLNDLGCHRLLPAEATYPLPSCRYPCIIKYIEAPYKIIMQPEPDGTPCMMRTPDISGGHQYVGRCSRGACLHIGNNAVLGSFEWNQSYETKAFHNRNEVTRKNYGTVNFIIASGGNARTHFLSEAIGIPHVNQGMNNIRPADGISIYSGTHGSQNALQGFLRVKRSPRGSYRAPRGYRRRQNVRDNRNTGYSSRGRQHYFSEPTPHIAPQAPSYPAIVIVNQEKPKRRKGLSKVGVAAAGAVAGAAAGVGGAAIFNSLKKANDEKHIDKAAVNSKEEKTTNSAVTKKEKKGETTTDEKTSTQASDDSVTKKSDTTETKKEEKDEETVAKKNEEDDDSKKTNRSRTEEKHKTTSTETHNTDSEKLKHTANESTDESNEPEGGLKEKRTVSETEKTDKNELAGTTSVGQSSHQDENRDSEKRETGGTNGSDVTQNNETDGNKKNEDGTDQGSGKTGVSQGAGTNATNNAETTQTEETEKSESPEKEKKRRKGLRGWFRRLFQ
uniref:Basic tail secreted protein n=1 Tax=Rhipicephalus zambeziensis TaxID=60191 RepID=A0A224Y7I3_9ACAR